MNKKKVSNCCWRLDRLVSEDGPAFSDVGLCPQCKEHCEFVLCMDPPCGALAPTSTE